MNGVIPTRRRWLTANIAAFALAFAANARTTGQVSSNWTGTLDEHPSIQYSTRPTADRVARWARQLAERRESLTRDGRSGYLRPLLAALDIPVESQLLVFSKTGVQRDYTGPETPRALYFNDSVIVAYIPGAPAIEIAAHDPQQGVVFYTLDQNAATTMPTRRTTCLACHVSASTLNVPGVITRSNFVARDGNILPQLGNHDVDHSTPHPDRWGGWLVTSEESPPPYSQRAHQGNITFTLDGATSNEVFVKWIGSSPRERGYLLSSSDIVALLAFDHQMHAINLLTKLNWEWRIAASEGRASVADAELRRLVNEVADYLLFAGEAPMPVPLTPPAGFASHLQSRHPTDRQGRSCAQLELVNHLSRYPCSYMVYSDAFDGLPQPVRRAVYGRMIEALSGGPDDARFARVSMQARRAALEILDETKPDFRAAAQGAPDRWPQPVGLRSFLTRPR